MSRNHKLLQLVVADAKVEDGIASFTVPYTEADTPLIVHFPARFVLAMRDARADEVPLPDWFGPGERVLDRASNLYGLVQNNGEVRLADGATLTNEEASAAIHAGHLTWAS